MADSSRVDISVELTLTSEGEHLYRYSSDRRKDAVNMIHVQRVSILGTPPDKLLLKLTDKPD